MYCPLGNVVVLARRSNRATETPERPNKYAIERPTGPPPQTITSTLVDPFLSGARVMPPPFHWH